MSHARKRYIEAALKKNLSWSKTISLIGMRQVGKTTLLKRFVKNYVSFDDDQYLRLAENSQWSFVDDASLPAGLDECQKCPPLFDRVKLRVDERNSPGQYILSGSVRFLSNKKIRESLTGRTVIMELLPMTLSEAYQRPPSQFLSILLSKRKSPEILKALEKHSRFKDSDLLHYGLTGGLPGICLKRDSTARDIAFNSQIGTVLGRDIDFIAPTRLGYRKLRNLFMLVCRNAGLPINQAALAREIATSKPTVKRILDAYEQLFLIRKHGNTYYPVDLGLSDYLNPGFNLNEHKYLLRLVYAELYSQLSYGSFTRHEFLDYKTRGGTEIPFVIHTNKNMDIAIAIDSDVHISDKAQIGLTRFKKKSKAITVILYRGDYAYLSHAGHLCIPVSWIF
jgi:predicted AAA+ superfamily ATPase